MIEDKVVNDFVKKLIDKYNSKSFMTESNDSEGESIYGRIDYVINDKIYKLQYIETNSINNKWSEMKYFITDKNNTNSIQNTIRVNSLIKDNDFKMSAVKALKKSIDEMTS